MKGRFLLLLGLAACGGAADRHESTTIAESGAILPVIDTVDGVPVMRHAADALVWAPKWTLAAEPSLVVQGDSQLRLNDAFAPLNLSDGRMVVGPPFGARVLWVTSADGRSRRRLAGPGQGEGGLVESGTVAIWAGDTIAVTEDLRHDLSLFTADGGLVRTVPLSDSLPTWCRRPLGWLPDGRAVAIAWCPLDGSSAGEPPGDSVPVAIVARDFSRTDTIGAVSPLPLAMSRGSGDGSGEPRLRRVLLTPTPSIAVVDTTIVVGDPAAGFQVGLLSESGARLGRIEVAIPRTAFAGATRDHMLATLTAGRLAQAGTARDSDKVLRNIAALPIPDTLAAYDRVVPGAGRVFWVVDLRLPGDSTWGATAFRLDGMILGRVTGAVGGAWHQLGPVRFEADRVMVREVDARGVIRFAVYALVKDAP